MSITARLFEPDPEIVIRQRDKLEIMNAELRLVLGRVQSWLSRGAPHDAERDAIVGEVERVLGWAECAEAGAALASKV
jgi:hypothetical protein